MWSILRARLGYWLARRLFGQRWAQQNARVWGWMQTQYARMAATGHREAQAFYGHLLYYKGQEPGAKFEGLRFLRLAAEQGDAKAAYQVGMHYMKEGSAEAVPWFERAEELEHPMAEIQLAKLHNTDAHE
ncbi:MAG TPA: hypothetical protein VK099_04835 [Alcanivoracaceae bacterium]|nr:hypothetical protein [Alcanivoracaceae bacterium]